MEYITWDQMLNSHGRPHLMIDGQVYANGDTDKRLTHDVCDKYAIYILPEANGGCMAYGNTRFGWVVNPSLRFPVLAMMSLLTKPINDTDLHNACLSYRHDFGLMGEAEKEELADTMRGCAEALQKTWLDALSTPNAAQHLLPLDDENTSS